MINSGGYGRYVAGLAGGEKFMGATRFIGVGLFYAFGIILCIAGIMLACRYQQKGSDAICLGREDFKRVEKQMRPELEEVSAKMAAASGEDRKALENTNLRLSASWDDNIQNLERIELEYRAVWLPSRNYALLVSVFGFALMVWGLYRVLKD